MPALIKKAFSKIVEFVKPDKTRSIQLDFLRGMAILLVIFCHVPSPVQGGWLLSPVRDIMVRFGWTGVDLFFVLSGFLVGGLLFKEIRREGRADWKRFIIRRGFKIWPAYFIYLFFLLAAFYFIKPAWGIGGTLLKLLPNFLHVQNYMGSLREHTWSLAVEEHFYLVLPLFLWLITMKRNAAPKSLPLIPAAAIVLLIFCAVMRYFAYRTYQGELYHVLYPTHLRVDGLFFGVFLSYIYHLRSDLFVKISRHRIPLLLLGLALISPMMMLGFKYTIFVRSIGLTMLSLGYGLILVALVKAPTGEGGWAFFFNSYPVRIIAFIGFHSYSIYLWHWEVGMNVTERLFPDMATVSAPMSLVWSVQTLIYVILAVLGGVFMGVLVERPFLALRDRLYPSRSKK